MTYGKRLIRERAQRRWTQKEVAERAGVTIKTISMIENEHQFPRPPIQFAIAQVFDLDPDDLFSRNGDEA